MKEDHGLAVKEGKLAIDGGTPVRREPLPFDFPGLHYMGEEEVEAVSRVLRARSPFRYYGIDPQKEVQKFEEEFASFTGARFATAVSSGTGALHVAFSALGVGPGQEVIVPAYLWVSILAAIVNHGAIPVLADIDSTFGLDPAAVEKCITPRTAGIVCVHMSGAPANVLAIQKIAREHKLFLLEDCAQCAGGSVGGQKVGAFGDMGIFSFQINKNMTSGEGGCIITNDPELYGRTVACHDLGYPRDKNGRMMFDHPEKCLWGMGYRMDEMRGAVLRVQLRRVPRLTAAMRASKHRLRAFLANFPGVSLRKLTDPEGDTGCFLITTYRDEKTAKAVHAALRAEGITAPPGGSTNILMTEWGLHLYYNNLSLELQNSVDASGFPWKLAPNQTETHYQKGTCPIADSLFSRSILLPIPPTLKTEDEDDIMAAFQKVLGALT